MERMEFKKIMGVFLLGSTILAEMYFQNREVKMLRSQAGFIAEEAIDILSGNIQRRDSDSILSSKEKVLRKLDQDYVRKDLDVNIADIKVCNLHGETILHLAAKNGEVDLVKYLLEAGQDADIRTRDVLNSSGTLYRDTRETPLHYAAASGNLEVMEVLVDHGGDVSAKTESGDTALHKAALYGRTSAVRWLLQRGADPEARNVFGATPLSMALVNQQKESAVAILEWSRSKDVLPHEVSWPVEVQACPILLLLEVCLLLVLRLLNS